MKRIIILLCIAVTACGTTFAKDHAIAYIDMAYILKNLP